MKAPRLSRSGIEYADLSWGIYSGCYNWRNGVCGGGGKDFNCWAKSIVRRFPDHYPNGFDPSVYLDALRSPLAVKKPSIITVGWMGDMFGDWMFDGALVIINLRELVFDVIKQCPQHRFLFLTKCYWNLPKWNPFPQNVYVGVTITDGNNLNDVLGTLAKIEAGLIWLSVEPMLGPVISKAEITTIDDREPVFISTLPAEWDKLGWVAVGAATKPYRPPEVKWVEELVWACIEAKIPVFQKDNLVKALPKTVPFYVPPLEVSEKGEIKMVYRQEMLGWD